MIVGHAHPRVVKALQEAATRGTSYGAPTLIESQLAQLVKEIYPSIEKLRMVNSGTEATMSAIRVARGYTGRDKIVKFIGCYHGHGDSLLVKAGSGAATFGQPDSPGVTAGTAKDTLTVAYNDADASGNSWTAAATTLPPSSSNPLPAIWAWSCRQTATCSSCAMKRRNTAQSSSSTKSCAASARPSTAPRASITSSPT